MGDHHIWICVLCMGYISTYHHHVSSIIQNLCLVSRQKPLHLIQPTNRKALRIDIHTAAASCDLCEILCYYLVVLCWVHHGHQLLTTYTTSIMVKCIISYILDENWFDKKAFRWTPNKKKNRVFSPFCKNQKPNIN